jgi:hypothetical protein
MRNWLTRTAAWLIQAKLLFLTLAIFLGAAALLSMSAPTEPHIRLAGLGIQLLGLSTVLYGISTTRHHFGLPSLASSATTWLRSFPRWRIPPATISGVGGIESATAFGRATVRSVPRPNATIEDRVKTLEQNFATLDMSTTAIQQQLDAEQAARADALRQERASRETELRSLAEKLQLAETGGLNLSFWGLIWLMGGLLMSTASYELAALFMR